MAIEPVPTGCWTCSGMGYRGMDRCNYCDCTGSVFIVNGESYPNTKKGFDQAVAAMGKKND